MKRYLAIILSAVCLLSCAQAEGFNEAGTFPICSETVSLTVAVPEQVNISDYETNIMTQLLEERGNFDLSFTVLPSTDYVTKINLMIQGGDSNLPDVIIFNAGSANDAMIYQWADMAAIIPLTEYYKNESISYWIHDAMDRLGFDFSSQMAMPDGEIYAVPTLNQSYSNEYPAAMYYYTPWLEALDMVVPTTTEELYELYKAVKNTDLNGNGVADEIPLTGLGLSNIMTDTSGSASGWFSYLMNSFVYAGDADFLTVDDGAVSVAYNTEQWKEGLKSIRRLFAEELIPLETLTMDSAQLSTLMNAEEVVVFSGASISFPGHIDNSNNNRNLWDGFGPMVGPEGVQYATYRPSVAKAAGIVTADCENPEAAFRFLDLMTSEYFSIMQRWGVEDLDWNYAEDVENIESYTSNVPGWPVSIVAYNINAFDAGEGDMKSHGWRQMGPYIRQYGISNGSGKNPDNITGYTKLTAKVWGLYQEGGFQPDEVIPKLIFTAEESEAVSDIMVTIKSYVCEMTSAFLAGNKDIDAEWDAYLAELEEIGVGKIIETVQGVYDRMYK